MSNPPPPDPENTTDPTEFGYTDEGPDPEESAPLETQTGMLSAFGTYGGIDIFQGGGPELARITATDYQFLQGLLIGPIAAANTDTTVPSVAVMRVHKVVCFKIVRWCVARLGTKPVLPSPNTNNTNEVLIYQEIGGSLPGKMPDGQQMWSMRGMYVYVLVQAPQPGDTLSLGGSWVDPTANASINTIIPGDFSTALSGPAPPVTSLVPGWASYVSP